MICKQKNGIGIFIFDEKTSTINECNVKLTSYLKLLIKQRKLKHKLQFIVLLTAALQIKSNQIIFYLWMTNAYIK